MGFGRWWRRKAPPLPRRRSRRRARNRCDLSSPRDAPEDLLRDLRGVDPAYDLHYLGEGVWVIGRVIPNAVRAKIGGKIKRRRQQYRVDERFAYLAGPELAYQGFGVVEYFTIQGEPDGRIVLEARAREWRFRNRAQAEFEERLSGSEGLAEVAGVPQDMGTDAWWDEIGYREKHVRPELFRSRRHFPQGALHR